MNYFAARLVLGASVTGTCVGVALAWLASQVPGMDPFLVQVLWAFVGVGVLASISCVVDMIRGRRDGA